MKWSWKIGEFRGIGVYMQATFPIHIGFVVAESLVRRAQRRPTCAESLGDFRYWWLSHWSAGHSVGKSLEGLFMPKRLKAAGVLPAQETRYDDTTISTGKRSC